MLRWCLCIRYLLRGYEYSALTRYIGLLYLIVKGIYCALRSLREDLSHYGVLWLLPLVLIASNAPGPECAGMRSIEKKLLIVEDLQTIY